MSTIVSKMSQSQWDNFNTISVVRQTTTMANYFKPQALRLTDQIKLSNKL